MGSSSDKEKEYCTEKMRSASWLIKSLYQRQRTLYKVCLLYTSVANRVAVELRYVNSENVTEHNAASVFKGCDGILVPSTPR